jgi:hypothetical protein
LNPDFVEGIIYTWNPDLGLNANNIGNPTILLDNTSSNFISYIYTVQYDSTGACSIDTFEVTVRPLPRINMNPQDSVFVCIGTSAVLDAGIAEVGLPTFSQYEWITGQNTQQITVDTQGVYSIKITDVLGCINFDSVFVEVNQPSIIVTTLIELCLGDSLILTIEDYSGGFVYWNGVQYGPQFTAYQSGTYEAIYQNACGIYVS